MLKRIYLLETILFLVLLVSSMTAGAQNFYSMGHGSDRTVYNTSLNGCSYTPFLTLCEDGEIAVYKDTLYYVSDSVLYRKIISTPAAPCIAITSFPLGANTITVDAAGVVYVSTYFVLYSYSAANGVTLHGSFPSSLNPGGGIDFYKGKLYKIGYNSSNQRQCIIEVNINQPALSTDYMDLQNQNGYLGLVSVPVTCDSTDFYAIYPIGLGRNDFIKLDMINKLELGVVCNYPTRAGFSSILPGGTFTRPVIDSIITKPTCSQTNNGSVRMVAHDPGRPVTYILNGITDSTGIFTGLTPGTYTITVMNDLGCTKDTSFVIGASTYPSVSTTAINLSSCITNDGKIAVVSLNNEILKYSINNGPYQVIDTFRNLAAGNYLISAINIPGCTVSSTVNLTRPSINKNGITITTTDPVCSQKNGSIQIAAQNVFTPISFSLNGISSSSGIFPGLDAASYQITVTDGKGCTFDTSILLKTFPIPHVDSINIKGTCTSSGNNGSINIFAANIPGVLTYTINTVSNNTGIFSSLGAGNYTARISNSNDCYKDTSLIVKTLAPPSFTATVINPDCLIKTGSIALSAAINNINLKYSINGSPYIVVDTVKNLSAGSYIISAMNVEGCTVNQTATIIANPDTVCSSIYFPGAFTPNHDGINELFKPGVYGVLEKYELKVYNRFGETVFETNDNTKGWDGTAKGKPVVNGIYVWYSTYKFFGNNQSEQVKKGTVVLLR